MSTTVDLGKITASVTVGTTTTGAAGTNASVSNSGTTQDAVLNFTIPRGAQGVQGPQGIQGNTGPAGPTGPQGPMGDVAVITPDQQAAFTMYSVPGQNTDGPMTQKAVTDNLVAGSISYDNSQSGLAAENVQGAVDEVADIAHKNEGMIDISQYEFEGGYISPISGKWSSSTTNKGILIPVRAGCNYEIMASDEGNTRYAFLYENSWSKNSIPSYASGSTLTNVPAGSSSGIITAPFNASYLYIYIIADDVARSHRIYQPTLRRITDIENKIDGMIGGGRIVHITPINAYSTNIINVKDGDIITDTGNYSGKILLSNNSDFSESIRFATPDALPFKVNSDYKYIRLGTASTGFDITIKRELQDVIEELDDELFTWTNATIARQLDGFCLKDESIWGDVASGQSVIMFFIGYNKKFKVTGSASISCVSCKILDGTSYSSNWSTIEKLNLGTGGSYSIEGETDSTHNYVAITIDTGTSYTCKVKKMDVENSIDTINNKVMLLDSITGKEAYSASDASLTNGNSLTISGFPYHIKKGLCMSFIAQITTFSSIQIGKGYNQYRGKWFEIDETNVALKFYESSVITIETKAHGLIIGTYIKVSMYGDEDGVMHLVIQSSGGYYSTTFTGWEYEANYAAFVRSVGSSLTSLKLNATCADFKYPVWVMGDSYCSVQNVRWPYYMHEWGYWNYMLCALAGQTSQYAYDDLNRMLNGGTPKYLLWLLGMNDTDEKFKTYFDSVKGICNTYGITMIAALVPTTPSVNNEVKKQYVIDSGVRYIDFYSAVGTNPSGNWYDGYLSNDNVHPTQLGAQALATQVLVDFPEIMEYRNG